jgi:hypothetical protein
MHQLTLTQAAVLVVVVLALILCGAGRAIGGAGSDELKVACSDFARSLC